MLEQVHVEDYYYYYVTSICKIVNNKLEDVCREIVPGVLRFLRLSMLQGFRNQCKI